jgi:hypothetical protein
MAYDAARRVIVLYGGEANGMGLGDTWEYDGATWVNTTSQGPPVCWGASMAFDAAREQIVLWGCNDDDTYTYDGASWTLRATTGPPLRFQSSLVYHGARGTVFMTGGYVFDGSVFGYAGITDTWEWDGSSWTEITGSSPTATGTSVYDPVTERIVAFGGFAEAGHDALDATSVWDGTWTDLTPATTPPVRVDHVMVYDVGRARVVVASGDLFGPGANEGSRNDTWELAGDEWQETNLERAPRNRFNTAGAFDVRRGRAVVHGGRVGDVPTPPFLYDTWELVGDVWRLLGDVGAPTDQTSPSSESMTYDEDAGVCLLLTRRIPATTDTWTFDGGAWSGDAGTGIMMPGDYAVTYDVSRDVVVMVQGGRTWEYDGASWWHNVTAPLVGGGSTATHLAYDPVREVVVFVGDDTWEYDTSVSPPTWNQMPISTPAHGRGALAWHRARGTIVFFTAATDEGTAIEETWEYDGTDWAKLVFPFFPPVGESPTLIDDPMGDRLLLIGGQDTLYDMWQMQWRSGSPDEDCGTAGDEDFDGVADCADPDCEGDFCGANGERCTIVGTCECNDGPTEARCNDGWDDDCDGLVDCADPDCDGDTRCAPESDCAAGGDEDGDGLADCADPGCLGVGFCEPVEVSCEDGEDNDGDGLSDCQDANCYLAPCPAVTP